MNIEQENSLKMTGNVLIQRINSIGEVVESREIKNLVVSAGKTFIASRMVGTTANVMSHMALGTGTTAAAAGDPGLQTELAGSRSGATGFSGTASGNQVTYTATFPPGVGTGAVTEAGIFNASSAGTMLCRTTFSVVNKAAGDSIAVTWIVTVN